MRKFYARFGKARVSFALKPPAFYPSGAVGVVGRSTASAPCAPAGRGHRGGGGKRVESRRGDLIDVVGRGRLLQLGFAAGGVPRRAAACGGRGRGRRVTSRGRGGRAEQARARPPRLAVVAAAAG